MADIFVAKPRTGSKYHETNAEHDSWRSGIGQEKEKVVDDVEVVKPAELPRGKARHKIHGHSHNPIAAFCYYPDQANFVAADKEEKIVLILRRHPITNLKWILTGVFMLISPFFISFVPGFNMIPENFQIVFLMVWYLMTMAFILEQFLGWYFNVNVITDERIFDVDFANLVYREITDANIDQIQDVTVTIGGVLRTMINYGDVLIQTAAEIPQVDFKGVPKPDVVAKILRELRVEEEQEKIEGRVR